MPRVFGDIPHQRIVVGGGAVIDEPVVTVKVVLDDERWILINDIHLVIILSPTVVSEIVECGQPRFFTCFDHSLHALEVRSFVRDARVNKLSKALDVQDKEND